jgi:type IV pilus assembly protein PilW
MSRQRLDMLKTRQGGVSLIELMIAIVLALLLLAGLIQVYLSSKQSYNAQEQLARMQESGRFAMDLITSDLRRAGYWGGTVDLGRITGLPGPILDPAAYSHTCIDGTWGRMIRWRVGGLDNAKGAYNCAASYDTTTASDILAVRYAGATPIDPAVTPLNVNGLYLRDNTESGVIMTGALAGDPANTPPAVDGDAVIAQVRPVNVHAYFVGDSGRTCPNGDAIPALMRVRLDSVTGLLVEEEIASGVEEFEVQYLLGDQYLDAGAIVGNDWLNVRAVRVWLLVRGECLEQGLVNTTAYAMGNRNIAAENVRRQLYVSTVMLRNTVVGE